MPLPYMMGLLLSVRDVGKLMRPEEKCEVRDTKCIESSADASETFYSQTKKLYLDHSRTPSRESP